MQRFIVWHSSGFLFVVALDRAQAIDAARLAGWNVERVMLWKGVRG